MCHDIDEPSRGIVGRVGHDLAEDGRFSGPRRPRDYHHTLARLKPRLKLAEDAGASGEVKPLFAYLDAPGSQLECLGHEEAPSLDVHDRTVAAVPRIRQEPITDPDDERSRCLPSRAQPVSQFCHKGLNEH